jgi:hypothetical protein
MIRTALLPTLAAVIALAGCVAGPDYAAPVSPRAAGLWRRA